MNAAARDPPVPVPAEGDARPRALTASDWSPTHSVEGTARNISVLRRAVLRHLRLVIPVRPARVLRRTFLPEYYRFGSASMTESRIARPFRLVAWSVLVAYSLAHFFYSAVFQAWTMVNGDFVSAFPGPLTLRVSQQWSWSARAWIVPAMATHHLGKTAWNYGPVLHVVTLPFALASTRTQALRLVLLVDYALIAATFVVWIRLLFPGRRELFAWLGILCIWLNSFPLLEALVGREIEIFELFLVTVAISALRKEREVLAGGAFGLAAMTKFLPLVFIPYLFVKGYRRAGVVAVITVASIAFLAQIGLRWERSVTLDQANSENTAVFPTAYANQALTKVLHKTFTSFNIQDPRPPTLYPRSLRAIGTGLDVIVFLATTWFVVRWRRYRFLELECALLMIVMCLVPSHANTYYFVFVLPALSAGVAAMYERPPVRSRWLKPVLAASIALTGFLLPMRAFEILTHIPGKLVARALQGWSLPFYGAMLACGLMVELHRIGRERRPLATAHAGSVRQV